MLLLKKHIFIEDQNGFHKGKACINHICTLCTVSRIAIEKIKIKVLRLSGMSVKLLFWHHGTRISTSLLFIILRDVKMRVPLKRNKNWNCIFLISNQHFFSFVLVINDSVFAQLRSLILPLLKQVSFLHWDRKLNLSSMWSGRKLI